jgi:hypothetical protein
MRIQLVAHAGAQLGRPVRNGTQGFVLGLSPYALVVKQDVIDGAEERLLGFRRERQAIVNPVVQVRAGLDCGLIGALRLEDLVFRR